MRDNRHTLLGPIGIAKGGVALTVFVEDELDGLIGDALDLVMQGLCQGIGGAAVDHDNPVAGDDEAQVVVMTRVFIRGRRRGADG